MKNLDLGRVLLLLASFIFLISCCNKGLAVENFFTKNSPVKNQSIYFVIKKDFIETAPDELTQIAQSTGTGASVLSTKTHSNIITAGHVCYGIISAMSNHTTYTLYDFNGRETNAKIVGLDLESDLCLLKIQRESKPIRISGNKLSSGDKVFYAGYPLGIYMPGSLHHFQGYYSGTDPASFSMFSLPAAPGSSGSPIVNKSGDLISVVSAVTADFDNLTIGASLERIGPFLAEYNH